jgi:hypothetical protein
VEATNEEFLFVYVEIDMDNLSEPINFEQYLDDGINAYTQKIVDMET